MQKIIMQKKKKDYAKIRFYLLKLDLGEPFLYL